MRYVRGFTLLETLIWISMFTLATGAVVTSVIYFYRANDVTLDQASAVYSAQRGVDEMVRTIREAAYASDGAFPIVAIDEDDMTFYADVDADPFIERVRYRLDGTNIVETVVDPSGDPPTYPGSGSERIISTYVRNADEGLTMFTYFDSEGNQILDYTDVADVRFVTINIVVDLDTDALPKAFSVRSSAALRNLIGE